MIKKVVYVVLSLTIGLCSCTQDEEKNNDSGYVDIVIGTKSETLTKSIVSPGGGTSWDLGDKVYIIDTDATIQEFKYDEDGAMSSARFKGALKSGQGKEVYLAYYTGENSTAIFEENQHLVVEREMDIKIHEKGVRYNSALLGEYCPMVSMPLEFDAEDDADPKLFHFYHLTCMIEGRVSITNSNYLEKEIDQVVFELGALGSTPFYKKINVDMNLLKDINNIEFLDECLVYPDEESVKTDFMSTEFNLQEKYTVKELIDEYKDYFPIPIFSLPTSESFNYRAAIKFYNEGNLQLHLEGEGQATKLNPLGLNILNFNNAKIVTEE